MKAVTALAILSFTASFAHGQSNPFLTGGGGPPPASGGGGPPPASGGSNPFLSGGGGGPPPAPGGGGGGSSGASGAGTGIPANLASYQCPGNDGALYTTHGVTFKLKCGHGTSARSLPAFPANSLEECADGCAQDTACQSCDWSPNTCNPKAEYIPTIPKPFMTWFPLAPRGCPYPRLTSFPAQPDLLLKSDDITCPDDDGKIVETAQGDFFAIQCCTQSPGTVVGSTTATDIKDCVNQCAADAKCNSVSYTSVATGADVEGTCTFLSDQSFQSTQDGKHHYLYFIDPPTYDVADTPDVLCTTDCPLAHGRQYTSQFNEVFVMECGMRHGTTVINKDTQPSLKDCMDACAALVPCHSVDWHAKTNTCYYGKHHGAAPILAPGWQSAHSMGCAGACGREGCCGNNGLTGASTGGAPSAPPAPDLSTKECPPTGSIIVVDNKKWEVAFKTGHGGTPEIGSGTTVNSVQECIQSCSSTTNCAKAHFNDQNGGCHIYEGGPLDPASSTSCPWDRYILVP